MISGRLVNTYSSPGGGVVAVPIAVVLGLVAARFRGTWLDKTISIVTLSAISLPEFFIGYILIFFFAVKLLWAPRSRASMTAWASASGSRRSRCRSRPSPWS